MITHRTCVDVLGAAPAHLYDVMANPTDARYRRWWPGTHLAFHVVRRGRFSPWGDLVVMDEWVGSRRLRFQARVRVAEPDRRLVWQLGWGVPGPAWLDIVLVPIPGGTRVEHELRLGWTGFSGRWADRLIRLYFTPAFADALTDHATREFPMLAEVARGDAFD